jgi:hypothetical protein
MPFLKPLLLVIGAFLVALLANTLWTLWLGRGIPAVLHVLQLLTLASFMGIVAFLAIHGKGKKRNCR